MKVDLPCRIGAVDAVRRINLAIAVKQLCRLNPSFTLGRAASYIFVNGLAP
jgi:hypothetical protein